MTTAAPRALPKDLVDLAEAGADPVARRVGTAVLRTVRDDFDPGERGWITAIESLRAELDASPTLVDTALPNARGVTKPLILGEVAAKRSKKGLWAVVLLALARELRPERTLELGTCVGISGAFLAAGMRLNGGGQLVTLEGAPALAALADEHVRALGLDDVEVVPGLFRDTLAGVLDRTGKLDLAFIDGHHDEEATQVYFEQLLPHLADDAVVVFDDIRWSDGMERAWDALQVHAEVRLAVDLDRIGICVVGRGSRAAVRLPALTAMAAAARPPAASKPAAEPAPIDLTSLPAARMNWGCGRHPVAGWLNSDIRSAPGVQLVGDIRDGLALADECLDYVVSIHALQTIPHPDLVPVLQELRRVLKPGGVLRLGLPDLGRGVAAWQRGDRDYFQVPDEDASCLSGKLATQLVWYGYSVSLFTPEWIGELLERAGFASVHPCGFQATSSAIDEIVSLDNREAETLFVEAVR
jgi:predicted O-methyltransferase YrrM